MDSTLELFRALAAHNVDASALLQPRTPVLQQQGLISGAYGASGAPGFPHDAGAVPGLGAGLNAQLVHAPGDLAAPPMHVAVQYQPSLAPLGGMDAALQQLALNGHPLLLQQQQQQAQHSGATPSALYQRPNGFDAAALSQLNMTAPLQQQCMVARASPFNLSTLPAAPRDEWQAGVVSSNNVLVSSLLPSINGSAFLGLAGLPGTAQGMVLQPMQVPPLQQQQQQQQPHQQQQQPQQQPPHQQQDAVDTDLTPFGTAAAAGMVLAASGIQQQQQEQGLATSQQALLQAALSHAAAANQLVAEAASAAGLSAAGLQVPGVLSSGGQVAGGLESVSAVPGSQQYVLPCVGSRDSMSQVAEASHLSLAGSGRAGVPPAPTPAAMVAALGQAGAPRSISSTNTAGVSSSGSSVLSTAYGGLASTPAVMGGARPAGSSLYLAHKQQQAQQRAAATAIKGGLVLPGAAGEPPLASGLDSNGRFMPPQYPQASSVAAAAPGHGAAPGAEGASASQGQHRNPKSRPPQQQQAMAAARTTGPPPGLQQVDSASSAAGAGTSKGKGLVTTSSTNTDGGRGGNSNSSSNSGSQWLNKKLNVKLYKTELCHAWEEQGSCRYGAKCQFAHGSEELRPVERHPRYKTEVCRHFMEEGACPYGVRCRFIHPTAAAGDAAVAPTAAPAPAPAKPQRSPAGSPPAVAAQQQDNGQAADPSKVGPRRLPVFQQLQAAPGSSGMRGAAAAAVCEGLEGTGIGDDSDPFGTADSASSMACFLAANAVLESPKQGQGDTGSFDMLAAAASHPTRSAGALSAATGSGEAAAGAQAGYRALGGESEAPGRLGWEGLWR